MKSKINPILRKPKIRDQIPTQNDKAAAMTAGEPASGIVEAISTVRRESDNVGPVLISML